VKVEHSKTSTAACLAYTRAECHFASAPGPTEGKNPEGMVANSSMVGLICPPGCRGP
jgi:hypothetical protein